MRKNSVAGKALRCIALNTLVLIRQSTGMVRSDSGDVQHQTGHETQESWVAKPSIDAAIPRYAL
jgi:hypothetical protein